MAYSGYLIAFGGVKLLNRYFMQDTYSTVPNQRTELSAERDNSNYLQRTTSPNHKTKIHFETIPLTLEEKIKIQNIISNGLINETERKYNITYWNDEQNAYRLTNSN